MACIYMRGGTWHIYYFYGGKRYRYSLETDNERAARSELKRIEGEIVTGKHQVPKKTSVREFLRSYLAHLKSNISPRHFVSRRSMLRMAFGELIPELTSQASGWTPDPLSHKAQNVVLRAQYLEDIAPAAIARYLDESKTLRDWAPATHNRARETLHDMYEFAIRVHEFVSPDPRYPNPVKAVPRKRLPAPNIRFLQVDDISVQLGALTRYPILRVAVATMIYAGLRRGEIVWLAKDDVDLDARLIRIRPKTDGEAYWEPKTKTNRVVPISDALNQILLDYPSPAGSRWYFPAPKQKKERWDEDNLSRMLRMVNGRKKLPWTCLEFRHTFGSHLAMNNVSLYKIATLMGNSPEICRRHYAALIPEELAECVEFRRPAQHSTSGATQGAAESPALQPEA
jgi:integrase